MNFIVMNVKGPEEYGLLIGKLKFYAMGEYNKMRRFSLNYKPS